MQDVFAREAVSGFELFDPLRVPSPCFVVDRAAIEANLRVLDAVAQASGAKILAALKAFSMHRLGPASAAYLTGTCASGLHEARLGHEFYGGEVHVYSPAFRPGEVAELLSFADHLVFNSASQWLAHRELCLAAQQQRPELSFGLRINPEHSEGTVALYDPCAPGSRLGMTREALNGLDLSGIDGLHFHTLCEQDLPPLRRTLAAVEDRFGELFEHLNWINFGGGHHITAPDYQRSELVELIHDFRSRSALEVYLEPGEAVAIHSGVLVASVLDLFERADGERHAMLDISATCHMPDTLEMPYRANVLGAGAADDKAHAYHLGAPSCLAGDRIGIYSFDEPLKIGQRLIFDDMAHYTMVKTTTFNGVPLPALALWDSRTDALEIVREFGYEDFRNRLS